MIERRAALAPEVLERIGCEPVGWSDYTLLRRMLPGASSPEEAAVVMEDSRRELSQHLPVCIAARGRVLVTGLGLGCVVRGLLASPRVAHVDVVELDPEIISRVWPHVRADGRATIHAMDARRASVALEGSWDFAWHDLFLDDGSLALAHMMLVAAFEDRVRVQGCWGWDRRTRKVLRRRVRLLGV